MLGLQTRRGSNHSAAHVGESNSRSNVLQIHRESVCVPSRWKVLSGEFRRRPTALAIKFRKPDRVGRRGLSEPGRIFSRLLTYAYPRLFPWLIPWLISILYFPIGRSAPSTGKSLPNQGQYPPLRVAHSIPCRFRYAHARELRPPAAQYAITNLSRGI